MIEPDDVTQQRPDAKALEPQEIASTVQVPAQQQDTTADLPALPYMRIEDLLSLRIASDPQISPDGSWIAFTVLHCNAETDTTGSSIWLVNSAASKTQPARQLTSSSHHDTMPRWSPDGQTLAFLSDRTGTAQIYLLPLNGGEPRQASTLAQGVTEYSWHPAGKTLLAHSYWKPEDKQAQHTDSEITSIYTRLDARSDGIGYKHGRHLQLWLLDLEGQTQRLTAGPVDLEQSCWSPDGTEIAFCANQRADADLSAGVALWVLTVASGHTRRLTPEDGLAQMPSWSPDGQYIAYLYTPDPTEAGNYAPWIVRAQGNEVPQEAVLGTAQLTCQTWVIDELRNEWLMRPQWYADSQALLVPVQEHGQVHLVRLDRAQNQIIYLTRSNGRYVSPQLSRDGQTMAAVRADWFTPGDIWSMDGEGKHPHKLTGVNDDILHQRQLIRPQRISWQAHDGLTIEGWLYLPPQAENGKVPLILAPHGGPTLAWGDSYVHEFQVLAGRGYAVLAPNPRGSAGYGEDFGRKVLNDWGGADFQDLIAGLDYTIASAPIDEQRLGIGGMSYGGYMTNWAITQSDRFKAAVSRNGISSIPGAALLSNHTIWLQLSMANENLQRERSALTHADRITAPLLLLHAEQDLWCPLSESMQFFVTLRKRKHPVELVTYLNVGHLMDWPQVGSPLQRVDRLRRTIAWFEKFV
jgi:dipeptidyl aminopeptidase/acylaminoacyl peptidase